MPPATTLMYPSYVKEEPILPIKSSRVGASRLEPYCRLLNRLFEPLIFLKIIGQTREKHTSELRGSNDFEDIRRKFLQTLAYPCNFKRCGRSSTAIAVEDAEDRYIFWVAIDHEAYGEGIVTFLRGIVAFCEKPMFRKGLKRASNMFRNTSFTPALSLQDNASWQKRRI